MKKNNTLSSVFSYIALASGCIWFGAYVARLLITYKMFEETEETSADAELALTIMHHFNIDRETLEAMPAFDEHLKPLFSNKKRGIEE